MPPSRSLAPWSTTTGVAVQRKARSRRRFTKHIMDKDSVGDALHGKKIRGYACLDIHVRCR